MVRKTRRSREQSNWRRDGIFSDFQGLNSLKWRDVGVGVEIPARD
jgi:hypothetical protein